MSWLSILPDLSTYIKSLIIFNRLYKSKVPKEYLDNAFFSWPRVLAKHDPLKDSLQIVEFRQILSKAVKKYIYLPR